MLNIVKIEKDVYDNLPDADKLRAETMFLCENKDTSRCSIFVQGKCYGEDIDEISIDTRIKDIELDLSNKIDENHMVEKSKIDLMFIKYFNI